MAQKLQKSSQTRLYLIEDRANPDNAPEYQSLARALGVSWAQGDLTPVRIPDPNQYGKFKTIEFQRGQEGLPTVTLESRIEHTLSTLLKLVRKGCAFDVQLHAGVCEDPRDFNGGWDKIYVFEGALATDYSTGEMGALDSDQDAPVNESVAVSGLDYFEIKRLTAAEIASTQIVQEVLDVVICDSAQCGECGIASDGCQKIFAVTTSAGGSPGLPAEVIYSPDAGATIGETNITSLGANEDPNAAACVGSNLIVVSQDSESLHYASLADILAGLETWAEVTSGFVGGNGPRAVFSASPVHTWIAAAGGYIYFSEDPTSSVTPQTAGGVTVEDLNAIHGSDEDNLVAVGDNNTVLFTNDGGATWAAVTGPAPAVNLNAVWAKSDLVWLVGSAAGVLYYTADGGANWVTKGFPGSGTGVIRDINFASPTVGYMAHDTIAPRGRILRTIDGGFSWYVLPEQAGLSLPLNDRINAVVACSEDLNLAFGAGLGDNASDGILMKLA
jgi:hypothetical protein